MIPALRICAKKLTSLGNGLLLTSALARSLSIDFRSESNRAKNHFAGHIDTVIGALNNTGLSEMKSKTS
jgi:hypothetical protein